MSYIHTKSSNNIGLTIIVFLDLLDIINHLFRLFVPFHNCCLVEYVIVWLLVLENWDKSVSVISYRLMILNLINFEMFNQLCLVSFFQLKTLLQSIWKWLNLRIQFRNLFCILNFIQFFDRVINLTHVWKRCFACLIQSSVVVTLRVNSCSIEIVRLFGLDTEKFLPGWHFVLVLDLHYDFEKEVI